MKEGIHTAALLSRRASRNTSQGQEEAIRDGGCD